MGHNSVVSGYPKSTAPQVDGLSIGPSGFGASQILSFLFMRIRIENAWAHEFYRVTGQVDLK